jgi:hypothetical protein
MSLGCSPLSGKHCAAPAKADKSPTFDANSSDELNRLDFIGHGTSSMSL